MLGRLAIVLVALLLTAFALALSAKINYALGRDLDGRYAGSPHEQWYKSQHNSRGEWCCNESDAHPYYGDYKIHDDGSVTVDLNGDAHVLPAYMILKGPNPTGHAVWWYIETTSGRRTYCFAPGTLS